MSIVDISSASEGVNWKKKFTLNVLRIPIWTNQCWTKKHKMMLKNIISCIYERLFSNNFFKLLQSINRYSLLFEDFSIIILENFLRKKRINWNNKIETFISINSKRNSKNKLEKIKLEELNNLKEDTNTKLLKKKSKWIFRLFFGHCSIANRSVVKWWNGCLITQWTLKIGQIWL